MLSSFGGLSRFERVGQAGDADADAQVFRVEYFDVRDAVSAKTALKDRRMFGVKLRLFTRMRDELDAGASDDDDDTEVDTGRQGDRVRLLDSLELGAATPTAATPTSSIPFPGSPLVEPPPPPEREREREQTVLFRGLGGRAARPRSVSAGGGDSSSSSSSSSTSPSSSSSGRVASYSYPPPPPAPNPNPNPNSRASLYASSSSSAAAAHTPLDLHGRRSSNHLFFDAVGRFRPVRNHGEAEQSLDVDFSLPGPVADVQAYEEQDTSLGTPTFPQGYPPSPLPPPPPPSLSLPPHHHHQPHTQYYYGPPPDPTTSPGIPFYAPYYTASSPGPSLGPGQGQGQGLHFPLPLPLPLPLPPPSPSFGYHPEPVGVGLHAWTWAPAPGGGVGGGAGNGAGNGYYIPPGSPGVAAHTGGVYYPHAHPHPHTHAHTHTHVHAQPHVQPPQLLPYSVNPGGEIPGTANGNGHGNGNGNGVEYDYASAYLHLHHQQQQQQDEGDRQQPQQYHEFFPTSSMFRPPSPHHAHALAHALASTHMHTHTHVTASPDVSPSGFCATPQLHPHPATPAADRNQLNLTRIEDGQDTRTTVMVKNIPNKMSDRDLIAYIGNVCPRKIDFLYLRMDFQNGEGSFIFLKDFENNH
jgi:hypothetical protein